MLKVVTQQRRGRASNPRLLDRKSDALSLSHHATPKPPATVKVCLFWGRAYVIRFVVSVFRIAVKVVSQ